MKHSTAQVVDAKQTRPSPAYERVWLRQTSLNADLMYLLEFKYIAIVYNNIIITLKLK